MVNTRQYFLSFVVFANRIAASFLLLALGLAAHAAETQTVSIEPHTFTIPTGVYNHHSSYKDAPIHLPAYLQGKTLLELFRTAGYLTFNQGKDHDDFHYDSAKRYSSVKGGAPWRGRDGDQPFFGQIQLSGGKYVFYQNECGKRSFRFDSTRRPVRPPPSKAKPNRYAPPRPS